MATTVDILKYILQLDASGVNAGAKVAEDRISAMSAKISGVMRTAMTLFAAGSIAYVLKGFIDAAGQEEAVLKRLEISVNNTGASFAAAKPRIESLVNALKMRTAFDEEEMLEALTVLTNLTGDYGEALKLLPNALDLAAMAQMPLIEAAQLLGRVTEETIARIGRTFPRLKQQTDAFAALHPEVDKAAYFLKLVNEQTSGQASAQLETYAGQVLVLKRNWEDFEKSIGKALMPGASLLLADLNRIFAFATYLINRSDENLLALKMSLKEYEDLAARDPVRTEAARKDAEKSSKSLQREIEQLQVKLNLTQEIQNQIAADKQPPKAEPAIVPSEEGFQKIRDIEEIYYKLGARTFAGMRSFYSEELIKYKDNAKVKEQIIKDLYRIELDEATKIAEIRLRGGQLYEGARRSKAPGGLITIPGGGEPQEDNFDDNITLWDEMWNNIRVGSEDGANALLGIFDGLFDTLSGTFGDIANMMVSAFSGDFRSAAAEFVNILFSIFDNTDSARQYREQLENIREEMERNIEMLGRMTQAEKERRKATLETLIAEQEAYLAKYGATLDISIGDALRAQIDAWRQEVNAISGTFVNEGALKNIKNFGQVMAYISGQGATLGYQEASGMASHFSRMFNLSNEEQIQLWTMIKNILVQNGNSTLGELWQIDETLKGLRDDVTGGGTAPGGELGGSQIYRSITSITESQGNLIYSVLNSIHAELRNIVNLLTDLVRGGGFGNLRLPSSGGVYIGNVTINAGSYASGETMAIAFKRELRARGAAIS